MTVADDLATLRARIAKSRATYVPGTPERYPAAELRGFTVLEAEALIESVEAEVARLRDGLRRLADGKCMCGGDWHWTGVQTRCTGCDRVKGYGIDPSDRERIRALLAEDGAA